MLTLATLETVRLIMQNITYRSRSDAVVLAVELENINMIAYPEISKLLVHIT